MFKKYYCQQQQCYHKSAETSAFTDDTVLFWRMLKSHFVEFGIEKRVIVQLNVVCRFHWPGQNCIWLSYWRTCAIECLTMASHLQVTATSILFGRRPVMERVFSSSVYKYQLAYIAGWSLRYVSTTTCNVQRFRKIWSCLLSAADSLLCFYSVLG